MTKNMQRHKRPLLLKRLRRARFLVAMAIVSASAWYLWAEFDWSTWPKHPGDCDSLWNRAELLQRQENDRKNKVASRLGITEEDRAEIVERIEDARVLESDQLFN